MKLFDVKSIMPRYTFVASILALAGLCAVGRAAYIIWAEYDYWMDVGKRFVAENKELPPVRGNILADDGQLLAASLPEYRLYMDFMVWEKDSIRKVKLQFKRDSLLECKLDSISQGMHAIFPDINPEEFKEHMREGRRQKSHNWPLYGKRVSYIDYRKAKALPLFKLSANRGGFHVTEYMKRTNPFGHLAARTIGDLYGEKDSARCGLERGLDSILRGKPGVYHRQKVLSKYLTIVDKPAENGRDILTTLNVDMQDLCEKALRDQLQSLEANSGVCILMEVKTGDVKAITSLTRLANGSYAEVRNAAVSNLMEPGSVFKPVSFMVGMNDGYITMNDRVDTGNGIYRFGPKNMKDHNWVKGGYGMLTVPEVLQVSSNVGVSYLINKYYHDNPNKFVDGVYKTGIAEDLHLPIPGYAKPRIRHPKPDGSNWSVTALPWMSIGYETQIPPISTLTFYNGVANGGKMVRPRFVKAIMRNGEVVEEKPVVVVREQMCKPEVLKDIQTCLEWVVSKGLGKKAGSPYFKVSGKTGTAQVWTKKGFGSQYLVSFVGYFPSEAPQYSCIVCIQKGYPASGGGHCGPVFKRVAEGVMALHKNPSFAPREANDSLNSSFPLILRGNMTAAANVMASLGMKYESNFSGDTGMLAWGKPEIRGGIYLFAQHDDKTRVPDVRGFGLRDALFRLEKAGLKVGVSGVGSVVSQSLEPGMAFKKGQRINIHLELAKSASAAEGDKPKAKPDSAKEARPASGNDSNAVARKASTSDTAQGKSKDKDKKQKSSESKKKKDALKPDDKRKRQQH